jgi:arginyl-tRNA synthetase
MIPGDIGAEIARLLHAGIAACEWPVAAGGLSATGTWRPTPADIGSGPRSYATSLPLSLAKLTRRPATPVAEALAGGLAALPWVSAAQVTGHGYLTITVTAGHLAGLAPRVVAAGRAAADSDALAGRRLSAPAWPDLSASASWEQAWHERRDVVSVLLADAAGAQVDFQDAQQDLARASPTQARSGLPSASAAVSSVVGDAVAFHGVVGYALARASAPSAGSITRQLRLPLDLDNPFVIVTYAHADAASTLRWAADLELPGRKEACRAAASASGGTLMRPELVLLNAMSWLPERVAAAARRRRPAELAAHLERLGRAWLDCRESCPALPFHGRAAPNPAEPSRSVIRLCLADAARVALWAGLGLLGIGAPERL